MSDSTTSFTKQNCGSFDEASEENKLEYTELHAQYVALVESELVGGDQEVPGEAFPHSPAAPVQPQPWQEHQKPRKEEGDEESPSPQPLQSQPA